ncbi:MAG: enoyl-CoA hydratase-related protein [Planctomycetota bacterium]|jgi:enoyl-CoA hydratase/carnithine racemase|nr:enoyl-CoA hydratase-related protein [Planctomycetota bacterium]MDP6940406.1 enoyl-CoA hydratase-related protein [Planctomycetota bacterium]
MSQENTVLFQREGEIARITLNRPDVRNAISSAVLARLQEVFSEIRNDSEIRVVVLTGAGDSCFCSGADLKERKTFSEEQVREFVIQIRNTMNELASLPQPTIAFLNGHAFGGGLEMTLACDFRILVPNASIGLTETSLAIIPGAGGCARLPRLIGLAKAKEMVLTARKLCAEEALAWGLVTQLGGNEEVQELSDTLRANGPLAVQAAKEALDGGVGCSLGAALQLEAECYEKIVPTQDRTEALLAFSEKRPPRFEGR